MYDLRITETGGREIVTGIKALGLAIDDFRPVWPQIEREFAFEETRQFDTEGGIGGAGRWKPLSEKYAEWKARKYPGRRILELTGALKASLTSTSGPGHFVERSKHRLVIGSNIPYGIYHQTGTSKMPARPPISLSPGQVKEFTGAIRRHIAATMKRVIKSR